MVVFTEAWNGDDVPVGHSRHEDVVAQGGCRRSQSSLLDFPTAPTSPRKGASDPTRSIKGAELAEGHLPVQLNGVAKRDGHNSKTGSSDAMSSAENGSVPECDVLGVHLCIGASKDYEAPAGVPKVIGLQGRCSDILGCWYLPAFIHFTCGPLGDVADSAALVFPVYLLLIAPFSLYLLHDVLDSRWRPALQVFGWQRRYLAFNAIVTIVLAVYAVIQFCAEDYKEVAATILVLLVGWVGAWKAMRGFIIQERFKKLQDNAKKLVRTNVDGIKIKNRGIQDLISAKLFDDDYPGEGPRIKFVTGYLARVAGFYDYKEFVDPKELALALVAWISSAHEVILDDFGDACNGIDETVMCTVAARVWNWMACTYGFRAALLADGELIGIYRIDSEDSLHRHFEVAVSAVHRMLFLDPTDRGTELFQAAKDNITQPILAVVPEADRKALPVDDDDTDLVDGLSAFFGFAISSADEVANIKEAKQAFMKLLVSLRPLAETEVDQAEAGLPATYSNQTFLIHIVYLLLRDHVFFSANPLPQLDQFDEIFRTIGEIRNDCRDVIVQRLQAIFGVGANHDAVEYMYSEAANFGTYIVKRVLYAQRQHGTTNLTCDMEPTHLWRFLRIWEIAVTDMVTILMGEHGLNYFGKHKTSGSDGFSFEMYDRDPVFQRGKSFLIYSQIFPYGHDVDKGRCLPLASGAAATVREARFFDGRDQPHAGWSAERMSNTQLAVAGIGWYHPDEWNQLVGNGQMDQLNERAEALVPTPERLNTPGESIRLAWGSLDACWQMTAARTTRQGGYQLGAATERQYREYGVIISSPDPVWQANYGAISHAVREISGREKLQPWKNWHPEDIEKTFKELQGNMFEPDVSEVYKSLMDPTAYDSGRTG